MLRFVCAVMVLNQTLYSDALGAVPIALERLFGVNQTLLGPSRLKVSHQLIVQSLEATNTSQTQQLAASLVALPPSQRPVSDCLLS
jgi:hypothetical protein